jgi:dihydrodiol dehydrogenase / D-xylose 1-dehydrogenase (NADP)
MIRWGILATGKIANSFAEDFRYVNGGILKAVASRKTEKARAFAEKHKIEKAFGTYEELARDKEIDAVYIATPHSEHHKNTILLLNNGKHVLCEKAFAVNAKEALEMITLAKSKNLFLMEAMWMVFQPGFLQAKRWIEEGKIGHLTMIRAEFGFKAERHPELRLLNPELAGGTLLDIGIYPVAIAHYLFNKQPVEINSMASIGKTGVDEQLSLSIKYSENQIAHLSSSFLTKLENAACIYGTEGYIHIPGFWHSKKAILLSGSKEVVFNKNTPISGYANEANHMNEMINSGRTESDVVTFEKTMEIMKIMDAVRKQIGVKYRADGNLEKKI